MSRLKNTDGTIISHPNLIKSLPMCHAVMSVDGEKDTVYKGIAHGACDYLLKPINMKDLMNIWQHVVRKNLGAMNHNTSESDDDDQRVVQQMIVDGERSASMGKKCVKKMENYGD